MDLSWLYREPPPAYFPQIDKYASEDGRLWTPFRKLLTFDAYCEETGTPHLVAVDHTVDTSSLIKTAGVDYPREMIDAVTNIVPHPNRLYVIGNALGATETWGSNRNQDSFPKLGLLNSDPNTYGHKTFEAAHVFKHHKNKDPNKSIGSVTYAYYDELLDKVLLLYYVLRDKAPHIVARLEAGKSLETSMGCRCPYDVCSICHNKAKDKSEYCRHLLDHPNMTYPDGRKVMAHTPHPRFFDQSHVAKGADPIAKTLTVIDDQAKVSWDARPKHFVMPSASELIQKHANAVDSFVKEAEVSSLQARMADADPEHRERMAPILAALGFNSDGTEMPPPPRKTKTCPKCHGENAYSKEIGADTSHNEIVTRCPDCGKDTYDDELPLIEKEAALTAPHGNRYDVANGHESSGGAVRTLDGRRDVGHEGPGADHVDLPVRLREEDPGFDQQVKVAYDNLMRLHSEGGPPTTELFARYGTNPSVSGVAGHEGADSGSEAFWGSVVPKPGDQGLRKVGEVRELPGGHGRAPSRNDPRPERQRRGLHSGELSVGHEKGAGQELSPDPLDRVQRGTENARGLGRRPGDFAHLPGTAPGKVATRTGPHRTPKPTETGSDATSGTPPPRVGDRVTVELEDRISMDSHSIVPMGEIPGTLNPADNMPYDAIPIDQPLGKTKGKVRGRVVGKIVVPDGNSKWVVKTRGGRLSARQKQDLQSYQAARSVWQKGLKMKVPGVKDAIVKSASGRHLLTVDQRKKVANYQEPSLLEFEKLAFATPEEVNYRVEKDTDKPRCWKCVHATERPIEDDRGGDRCRSHGKDTHCAVLDCLVAPWAECDAFEMDVARVEERLGERPSCGDTSEDLQKEALWAPWYQEMVVQNLKEGREDPFKVRVQDPTTGETGSLEDFAKKFADQIRKGITNGIPEAVLAKKARQIQAEIEKQVPGMATAVSKVLEEMTDPEQLEEKSPKEAAFAREFLPLLEVFEPDLAPDFLNKAAESYSLGEIVSTFASEGIVLKPSEFQHLVKVAQPESYDDLDPDPRQVRPSLAEKLSHDLMVFRSCLPEYLYQRSIALAGSIEKSASGNNIDPAQMMQLIQMMQSQGGAPAPRKPGQSYIPPGVQDAVMRDALLNLYRSNMGRIDPAAFDKMPDTHLFPKQGSLSSDSSPIDFVDACRGIPTRAYLKYAHLNRDQEGVPPDWSSVEIPTSGVWYDEYVRKPREAVEKVAMVLSLRPGPLLDAATTLNLRFVRDVLTGRPAS